MVYIYWSDEIFLIINLIYYNNINKNNNKWINRYLVVFYIYFFFSNILFYIWNKIYKYNNVINYNF